MANADEQYKELANQFILQFVTACRSDPQQLAPLYLEPSMLLFEGKKYQGPSEICTKLCEAFSGVDFQVTTVDALPTPDSSLVITALGQLKDKDQANPIGFFQVFVIKLIDGAWMKKHQ